MALSNVQGFSRKNLCAVTRSLEFQFVDPDLELVPFLLQIHEKVEKDVNLDPLLGIGHVFPDTAELRRASPRRSLDFVEQPV